MADIGVNLSGVVPWSAEFSFLDRVKSATGWRPRDFNFDYVTTPLSLDEQGYPTQVPDGIMMVENYVAMDPPGLATTDNYVVTWDGTGTLNFIGATVISSEPGRIVVHFTGLSGDDTWDQMGIDLMSTDPANPLHNLHVVREDQVDLFNSGEIFNPAFLQHVSQMDDLRFMDWGLTNSSTVASWSDRAQVGDMSWGLGNDGKGVPIEIMVQLANETHTGMWYNVPTYADDDYVKNALQYIHDHLDPTLTVHIEYSNEVWNWGFPQTSYAQNMAVQLWGPDAVTNGNLQYYGYRSAQVAAMANAIWADSGDARLENVLSTQTSYHGIENYIFQGVARAGLGSVASLFDEWAITGYFGNDLSYASTDPAATATVLGWARSGAAGMDAAFHQLQYGGALSTDQSLAALYQDYAYQESVAKANGLSLVAYEGGSHIVSANFSSDIQGEITAFFNALAQDPRMGQLYQQNAEAFAQAGGDLFNQFNDTGAGSKFGQWGSLTSIYDDSSPRWEGYLAARGHDKLLNQNLIADAAGSTLVGGDGQDWLRGQDGADTLHGGAGNDILDGGAGNDTLYGEAGNDVLIGGPGDDRMIGGLGDDTYHVDSPGDVVIENPGEGYDTIVASTSTYTLPDNVEVLRYAGTGMFTGYGNDADNVLIGGDGGNALYGGAGADILTGGAGNDLLDGGPGADKMAGGAGDDIYVVDDIGDVVTEFVNGGHDTVRTSLNTYILPANVEDLVFTGTGSFSGYGNNLDNRIVGGDDNDTLYGIGGVDTLVGGRGDDVYLVYDMRDVIIENPGEGRDVVYANAGYTLPANVEELYMLGSDNFFAYGNDLANVLQGNDGDNLLEGLGGDDLLRGGAGNDILYGGAGRDTLYGGAGADIFAFAAGDSAASLDQADMIADFSHAEGDRIDLSLMDGLSFIGSAAFDGAGAGQVRVTGSGTNWVVSGDTNGDGITDFTIAVTSATALVASDFILASGMQGPLDGGGRGEPESGQTVPDVPADSGTTPDSGAVPDTGTAPDSGTPGSDPIVDTPPADPTPPVVAPIEVRTMLSALTLGPTESNLTALTSKGFRGDGNALDNVLTGGTGHAALYGHDGNDTLIAGSGGSRLDGGAGDDTLIGGTGKDMLVGGTGADILRGGAGDDLLYGGDGNDILEGGAGKDIMLGGAGADLFVFTPGSTAAKASHADSIRDFSHAEGDRIDLSAWDIPGNADNAFTFLGQAAFSHHAGELRFTSNGHGQGWMVMGDVNGDGVADFMINVHSTTPLQANDFVL